VKYIAIHKIAFLLTVAILCTVPSCIPNKETDTEQLPDHSIGRTADPIVIRGESLPQFLQTNPSNIVLFYFDGKWKQAPVQIDDRVIADFYDIYNGTRVSPGVTEEFFADENTLTGPDTDPLFDENDQLVFMATDSGLARPQDSLPPGVNSSTGYEVIITDPLAPDDIGYAYLFVAAETLDQSAGKTYGQYSYRLDAGTYPGDYNFGNGLNHEDSWFTSEFYRRHFSYRWVTDGLEIFIGKSSGASLIEMYNVQFSPLICTRSVMVFSNGEGAMITNRSGPVRSIRSYMGAKSGPLTQREHLFYPRREEVTTFLRVHEIPNIMVLNDFNSAVEGLTYYNSLNREGVAIDGVPDEPVLGNLEWEMTVGPAGAMTVVNIIETDIYPLEVTSYYQDESPSPLPMCTGDDTAWGLSGTWIISPMPDTDPRHSECENYLRQIAVIYYDGPDADVEKAEQYNAWVRNPLSIMVNQLD
jgi:hypothetical protein